MTNICHFVFYFLQKYEIILLKNWHKLCKYIELNKYYKKMKEDKYGAGAEENLHQRYCIW